MCTWDPTVITEDDQVVRELEERKEKKNIERYTSDDSGLESYCKDMANTRTNNLSAEYLTTASTLPRPQRRSGKTHGMATSFWRLWRGLLQGQESTCSRH